MVINIFGKRGAGKTTLIKGQVLDCRPPVIIIDVLGNYEASEYFVTEDLGEAIDAAKEFYLYSRKENVRRAGYSARYYDHPKKIIVVKTGNPTLAADYFSAVIWEMHGGTLILDEVDSIKLKEGSCFDEFIRYGRNHKGDLITGCRRPAELSRNISAAANKFYCFRTNEPRDIDYFENIFGSDAPKLMRLEPYHGLFIDHDEKSTGIFQIDASGRIFHTKEVLI